LKGFGFAWSVHLTWKYIHIHLKRFIIYIDLGPNYGVYFDIKNHWMLSMLANKSEGELSKFKKD
jgi:hypothetical protein